MSGLALETRALCKTFGGLTVAANIGFRLEPGARHALIGPNGAGKTTFVNMLTGRLAPSSGRILLGGEDVTGLAPEARVKRGLGRTFQKFPLKFTAGGDTDNGTIEISATGTGAFRAGAVSLMPAAYKDAISVAILLAILFVRPRGLFGSAEVARLEARG